MVDHVRTAGERHHDRGGPRYGRLKLAALVHDCHGFDARTESLAYFRLPIYILARCSAIPLSNRTALPSGHLLTEPAGHLPTESAGHPPTESVGLPAHRIRRPPAHQIRRSAVTVALLVAFLPSGATFIHTGSEGIGMSGLSLAATQLDRYSRHIIMEEIGPEGQQALLDARVLVIGAGGLGSPVIQYLAAAGVGTIGIADDDVVERSNLQRQIVHTDADVGRPKVDSAAEFVAAQNPDVTVERHPIRIDANAIGELLEEYAFVVDGSDNFATRYLVNDACTLAGIPFSHGAIYKFEGQVTTITDDGPCYRCIFPEAPPAGTVPDCATTGVLGVLPGTIGCIQATETVKWIIGAGDLLTGRLLVYDAMDMRFEEVPVRGTPDCPICGNDGIESIDEVTYEDRCRVGAD